MRNIRAIGELPTCFVDVERGKCHESILRAWSILNEVKYLLREAVPANVILELIEDMEDASYPGTRKGAS